MNFSRVWPPSLAIRLGSSALAIGSSAAASVLLAVLTSSPVGAIAAAVVCLGLIVNLARLIANVDDHAGRAARGLAEGARDRAALPSLPKLYDALDAAADKLIQERAGAQIRINALQAILDTIPSPLLVLDHAGDARPINRAALRWAGLDRRGGDGDSTARANALLAALRPGTRELVRLHGQMMLASVSYFEAAQLGPRRLVSLQSVTSDLGPVETKAWQDLTRVMAHEIMNSLTPITSLALSISEAPELDPRRDPRLARIAEAAGTIARRSGNLLDFVERYRFLAAPLSPRITRVPIRRLLNDVVELTSPDLRGAAVALKLDAGPPSVAVDVDRSLLEQALINLILNARDACSGAVNPRVEIFCQILGDAIGITVSDNGHGVLSENKDLLFVPFFTTKPSGAGIGLSFVRQVMSAHGGRIELLASPLGGASFRLMLPRPADGHYDIKGD